MKTPETPSRYELLRMPDPECDYERVAEYATLEEALDDLIICIRNSIDDISDWDRRADFVCLADIEGGFAYVNVMCTLPGDEDREALPGKSCKIIGDGGRSFASVDDALPEIRRMLQESIETEEPVIFDLRLSEEISQEIYEVMVETFQGVEFKE